MALADINDFANAKATGCDGFTPAIRQAFPGKRDAWAGVFESGGHRLEVISDLEPIGQKSSGARAPIWAPSNGITIAPEREAPRHLNPARPHHNGSLAPLLLSGC